MHEIGVVRSMVKTVTAFAEANQITDIAEIVVDVGELSLVIPKYVEDIYPHVVEDTFLKNTKLILNIVPGMAERPRRGHGVLRAVQNDYGDNGRIADSFENIHGFRPF